MTPPEETIPAVELAFRTFVEDAAALYPRSPYVRIFSGPRSPRFEGTEAERVRAADDGIIKLLRSVDERGRGRWLFDCVEHAWQQHAQVDLGAPVFEPVVAAGRALLDGVYAEPTELHVHLSAIQQSFNALEPRIKANREPRLERAAHTLYATGMLSAHFVHLVEWFTHERAIRLEQPSHAEPTWFGYRMITNQWYPFWLVLDGCATVGGAAEREWALEAMKLRRSGPDEAAEAP